MDSRILIIGAGQAGLQSALSLRQFGHRGPIALIGDEHAPPYQRPPLSKAYMKGDMEEARLFFKPADWYTENSIELITGRHAERIDPEAKAVEFADGGHSTYDHLILATGSRPRPLPVPGRDGGTIFDLRTLADVQRIRPRMQAGNRLLIVGAGYIGLEAAAVGRQLGLDVTIVEQTDRVLSRVTSPVISAFFAEEHQRQGVHLLTENRIQRFEEYGTERVAVLEGGASLAFDLAIIGIGIVPNTDLAEQAGLRVADGIVIDENARTSDPAIFAAGDCTVRPLAAYRRSGRLESVHNAIEQGKLAAAAIAGKPQPAIDCPWFWSDQYDLKLQIAGLSTGYDDYVVRGHPADRSFAVFYLQEGRLIAADAINMPPAFLAAKRLIQMGARPDLDALGDPAQDMKNVLHTAMAAQRT